MSKEEEYYEKAKEYLNIGNTNIAICYLEKAIENNINNFDAYIKFYELKKEKDINLILESIKIKENKWSYLHILDYYKNQGDLENFTKFRNNFVKFINKNYKERKDIDRTIFLKDVIFIYQISHKLKKIDFNLDEIKHINLNQEKDINNLDFINNLKINNKKDCINLLYYYSKKEDYDKFYLVAETLMDLSEDVYFEDIQDFVCFREQNFKEKNIDFFEINLIDIKKFIKFDDLIFTKNKLECICLLLTGKELLDGSYNSFIEQLAKTNLKYSKEIDFKIFSKNKIDLEFFKNYFKNVYLVDIKIPEEYDFYLKEYDEKKQNLKYGEKSGPNYVFYKIFDYLKMYNTTLFLECDCVFSEDWIEKIITYTENNRFWISGSTYDGYNNAPIYDLVNTHINGGTALYATGNENFQKFIMFYKNVFFDYIKKYKNFPYDYMIKKIIDDYFDSNIDKQIWNFIKRQYVYNNIIINLSKEKDYFEDIKTYERIYDFAIMHKKLNNI